MQHFLWTDSHEILLHRVTQMFHSVTATGCLPEKLRHLPSAHAHDMLIQVSFNTLWPVVTVCTTSLTFNNSTFCPHSVFMCLVWIWEQTAIISLYSFSWLVCITERKCVYCAVRTEYLCFVWIWEQTAIISLHSINWLVCITEKKCVYCAVRTQSLYGIPGKS